jgi:predicted RNA-binding protein YlqC (UPF0109 family)
MVRIRMQRVGRPKTPHFRIVASGHPKGARRRESGSYRPLSPQREDQQGDGECRTPEILVGSWGPGLRHPSHRAENGRRVGGFHQLRYSPWSSPVELVTSIVKNLVDKPENVDSRWLETEKTVEINVVPDDRGKVIGRRGKTIDSLRILVSAVFGRFRRANRRQTARRIIGTPRWRSVLMF